MSPEFSSILPLDMTRRLRAGIDLGAIAVKRNSAFPKAPALLETHYQIVQYHILATHCSLCILQPQPKGQYNTV